MVLQHGAVEPWRGGTTAVMVHCQLEGDGFKPREEQQGPCCECWMHGAALEEEQLAHALIIHHPCGPAAAPDPRCLSHD